jgi:hypothetical protein
MLESSCLHALNLNRVCICSAGTDSDDFNMNKEFEIGDNTIIDVEVDMNNKLLYYFIGNKQCPFYVNNISSSNLLFGISAVKSSSVIEVISIKKVNKSSVDPSVKCKPLEWNKVCVYIYLYFLN